MIIEVPHRLVSELITNIREPLRRPLGMFERNGEWWGRYEILDPERAHWVKTTHDYWMVDGQS